ncbi:hypothetical protein [Spirosoma sp.]|uniref:hypothetical protein n=1 Tax=Spirosoma sp. TaxID=1899569 RepID=UPI00260D579D|nr:hypothetical protein [Spirosoma sp.]MCX6217568.1 hypothetical protein [Spirosoma sp.]
MKIPFDQSLVHLVTDARSGNPQKNDIATAVGEMTVSGVEYQIQLQLVATKKMWVGENEVRRSEVVKIHG